MSEVRFYHLQKTSEEMALPQIALKAWQAGHRVVVRAGSDTQVDKLNNALWTFRPDIFLPHGSKDDGYANHQPVWLTSGNDNPNGAKTLILATGAAAPEIAEFDLCCAMLDGNDPSQVDAARAQWKVYKDAGHTVSYWQQGDKGWEKKA
jgi:DNA polymerase III subunit chi